MYTGITRCSYFESTRSEINSLGKSILIGQFALWRVGLTRGITTIPMFGVEFPMLNDLDLGYSKLYYTPWAEDFFETVPEQDYPTIFVPSKERAIVEAIVIREYVDEGILVESIYEYISHHEDLSKLYEVSDYMSKYIRPHLDYWINEARNETFEG